MSKTFPIFILAWICLSLVGYFLYIDTVENDLKARSLKALSSTGHEWLSINLEGRDLTLHGNSPNKDALIEAENIVSNVYGVRVVETDVVSHELSDQVLLEMKNNGSDIASVNGDSDLGENNNYVGNDNDAIRHLGDEQIATSSIENESNSFYPCSIDIGSMASHTMIYFETSSSVVDSQGIALLGKLAALLNDCPFYRITITGHTDLRGNQLINQQLSEQRAANVEAQLVRLGVSTQRIDISGVAASSPATDNMTIDGLAGNRRVEIALIQ